MAGVSFPTDLEKFMPVTAVKQRFGKPPKSIPKEATLFHSESLAMQQINTPRVLYIEDHDDTRELVTLVLEQKSYEVVTGTTIQSGFDLAHSQNFDLYLLDSWLPDGSGLDLCRQIREFDKATIRAFG